jgi:anaerobic selenocysteine-containing dehydrogenase
MSTIGDDLLRPASPQFGPQVEAVVVYNSNPVAVAPDSGKVVAGFAREDLFTVVIEQFQTDTADYADWILPATTQLEHWDLHTAYGHTDVLLNRPAIAPVGSAKPNSQIFRELAARLGFDEPCFHDSDEQMCRQAFGDRIDWDGLLARGFTSLQIARGPVRRRPLPHGVGQVRVLQPRAGAARPRRPARPPAQLRAGGRIAQAPAGDDLAAGAQLPQLHVRQPGQPAGDRARAVAGDPSRRTPRRARSPPARWCAVFNDRGSYRCKAEVTDRARPGVVVGLGVWWRKMGLDGTNVNQVTSQRLTDLGNGPVFYDCAVDVQAQ